MLNVKSIVLPGILLDQVKCTITCWNPIKLNCLRILLCMMLKTDPPWYILIGNSINTLSFKNLRTKFLPTVHRCRKIHLYLKCDL